MGNYTESLQEEKKYLAKVLTFIKNELQNEKNNLSHIQKQLVEARKEMWENTAHSSLDFTKLTEMNQYLNEVNNRTVSYQNKSIRVNKYRKMIDSPYFGSFNFSEIDSANIDRIYIGLANVMDLDSHEVYVYDWRAPISSIFYRYELGKAEYTTPNGTSQGEVLAKRQYKISKSQLEYFFDCSIRITDEILKDILSRNTSPKMKSIVETIQKEQDQIIRNTENDLMIVQGVAGSGKTSIALHRIAYLLYHGLGSNLNVNNFIIISPNKVFSKYIANVLPELGEENVSQKTFDEIISQLLENRFTIETKLANLESQIYLQDDTPLSNRQESFIFKGSLIFGEILDRYLKYYKHNLIDFQDVFFAGKVIETRQQLKNRFLNSTGDIPLAKQLKRIEKMVIEKLQPLRKERLAKIEKIVQKSEGHDLEIKSFSRLLSIKEAKTFLRNIRKYTEIDYWEIYKNLFSNQKLFFKLAEGLPLPPHITKIVSATSERLSQGLVLYEDSAPLLYMMLKIEGCDFCRQIKQVVIDEAQDYSPLNYEIFKLLFKDASFTILGDIAQGIERDADQVFFSEIAKILDKERPLQVAINKGYRSTYEINTFTQKLLDSKYTVTPFERHGQEPAIIAKETIASLNQGIVQDIARHLREGNNSIAVICKTQKEAQRVYNKLKNMVSIRLITPQDELTSEEVVIIPSYLAKGLEFDVVIAYDVNKEKYKSQLDKKLLYIICTRALHQLTIYYTKEKSVFLNI